MLETLVFPSLVELCTILSGHRANQGSIVIPSKISTHSPGLLCLAEGKAWLLAALEAAAPSPRPPPTPPQVMTAEDGGGGAYERGTSLGAAACLSLRVFCCFWDQTLSGNNLKKYFAHCFAPSRQGGPFRTSCSTHAYKKAERRSGRKGWGQRQPLPAPQVSTPSNQPPTS